MPYLIGQTTRLTGAFSDNTGPVDPSVVTCRIRDPAGKVHVYRYGTDPELIRKDKGSYELDIDLDQAGIWWHRWEATDGPKMVSEAGLVVEASRIL